MPSGRQRGTQGPPLGAQRLQMAISWAPKRCSFSCHFRTFRPKAPQPPPGPLPDIPGDHFGGISGYPRSARGCPKASNDDLAGAQKIGWNDSFSDISSQGVPTPFRTPPRHPWGSVLDNFGASAWTSKWYLKSALGPKGLQRNLKIILIQPQFSTKSYRKPLQM